MTWNYRIVRYADGSGYGLHEVYYDKHGNAESMTSEPATFFGDTQEELVGSVMVAKTDMRLRPVFEEPDDWV